MISTQLPTPSPSKIPSTPSYMLRTCMSCVFSQQCDGLWPREDVTRSTETRGPVLKRQMKPSSRLTVCCCCITRHDGHSGSGRLCCISTIGNHGEECSRAAFCGRSQEQHRQHTAVLRSLSHSGITLSLSEGVHHRSGRFYFVVVGTVVHNDSSHTNND